MHTFMGKGIPRGHCNDGIWKDAERSLHLYISIWTELESNRVM